MRKLVALIFGLMFFHSGAALALTCNDPSGFLKSYGPMTTGQQLVLGPDCQHVQALSGGAVTGPPGSAPGAIAWWVDSAGTTLGASPYQIQAATNPGAAGLYSIGPNPGLGYTGIRNGMQINQGLNPLSAANQYLGQIVPVQQAIVGAVVTTGTDTDTWQASGLSGYALATSPPTAGLGRNMVGVFGQAATSVGPANLFGGNFLVTNDTGSSLGPGFDINYASGIEIDLNIWKKAGGADPTVNGGHLYGITIAGGGDIAASPTNSAAILVNMLAVTANNVPWNFGIQSLDGAATIGAQFGTNSPLNNVNSQAVRFVGRTAGAVNKTTDIHGDPNGTMIIAPDSTSGVVAHLNAIGGATVWQSGPFGTAKQNVPNCTTAGVITNDAGGNFNCSGTLTPGMGGGLYAVSAIGVNFNAVGDTAIPVNLPPSHTRIFPFRINIDHASASITTATFGIFPTTGGGGLAVVPGGSAITVSTAADATLNNAYTNNTVGNASYVGASMATPNTFYFRVTNPQGSAATADVQLMYFVMP